MSRQKPLDINSTWMGQNFARASTRSVFPGKSEQWKEERKWDVDITVNERDLLATDKMEKDGVKQLCFHE